MLLLIIASIVGLNEQVDEIFLVVCGFNILYYGSVSARFSKKPRFGFGFGFVTCFSALSLPLTYWEQRWNGAFVRFGGWRNGLIGTVRRLNLKQRRANMKRFGMFQ